MSINVMLDTPENQIVFYFIYVKVTGFNWKDAELIHKAVNSYESKMFESLLIDLSAGQRA